ncbi:MAG: hypothetical protein JW969_20450 [Spirochaetales bacterium]|nr:hypothetical protein [Spirochaetales bacterium]
MKYKNFILIFIAAILSFSACDKQNNSLKVEKITGGMDMEAPTMELTNESMDIKPGEIPKAEDGYTIKECYNLKMALEGKTIKVRGKVVKYNPRIMDRNWIHIQDGTGGETQYDLTVTSPDAETSVGKIILVSGVISYDKSFGMGLDYPVILENCQILEEK